ncbi:helix-turn-helix transcriptional regulator [Sphaerisporangium sp. B11E5]|uniref:PadR family transcriptional regulator n=1 Tax=Sphaerisporangium sp. B11E5 TaxID=3153563 RepID=UPI00325D1665
MYGLEICAAAGLQPGTIHPILARLEGIGWLESRWEDLDPHEAKRPRRRYYQLTPDGLEQARVALAEASTKTPQLSLLPQRPIMGGAT